MNLRENIANSFLSTGRSLGQTLGLELAVEVSDHSIEIQMEHPDKDTRAWDPNLYSKGNLFHSEYANPIKPRVEYKQELENPSTIAVDESDVADESEGEEGEEETDDGPHVQLISSGRYREYMRQDLISQLLTPDAQWKLIAYAVIGMCVLQFVSIIITLYATGQFA